MNAPSQTDPTEHLPQSPERPLVISQDQTSTIRRLVQIRKIIRFAAQRGFARFDNLDLNSGRLATTGILLATKSIKSATRAFATLTDGRDQIQLVLTSGQVGIPQEVVGTIERGARVLVTGVPFFGGRCEATAIPSLFVVELHRYVAPAPVTFDETGLQREVTPRLVIGSLMSLLSQQLEVDGYVRYEPRFITSSQVGLDTEPLMVRFPGRGANLFLEVSPLPQLLYAAIMTGKTRLYSPTRLFSRAYRDGFTSVDSPIIAAVETETRGNPKSQLEDATRFLLSGFNKAEQCGLPFDSVPDNRIVVYDGAESPAASDSITIRFTDISPPMTSQYAYDVRRRVEVETPTGQVLIEGHEGKIAEAIPYNWLCMHVERLALADFWRIRRRRGLES